MDLLRTDGDSGLQVVWEDGERVVCRGWRLHPDGNRTPVLAVRPAVEHPAPATLDRLAHEFGLRDELNESWALRPLALIRHQGQTTLVLADPGGEPLDRLLGTPVETGRFLHLAIGIVAALGALHQRGLVHKDLKPAHILLNRTNDQVWLTGFGIASPLPSERQPPEPAQTIAGTLAYMAPEQTGRMNRSIDTRSDLYALGVTFYQMLTGALPFTAADPMEWVHCHIARQPVPPAARLPSVPEPVSAIVMKLLAKTAEARYQTAAGVEHDLRRCLAEWEGQGRIDDFPLGQRDTPDRLLIPERLYGREREIAALLAAFDRTINSGTLELVLVSGYAGIGKSSVVNELNKGLVPLRGLFATGKFDQYKRDIPYATLAQAFQGLVRSLLGKSDAELAPWREALREALGLNGQLMIDLIPALEALIGRQPSVPELPPQDAQRRFQVVFRRLLGVFARPEHPLALFLDDLQWLDAATMELIGDLMIQSDVGSLLLLGAFRDNEVGPTHPLARSLQGIRRAGGRVSEIVLSPLARTDVEHLVADSLHATVDTTSPLAELVYDKTGGNPFFTIQFLTTLAEEKLLRFSPQAERWVWDLQRIRAKGYTENVVDLMVGKLAHLKPEAQEALQWLAALGNTVDFAVLAVIPGRSVAAIHAALWEAVRAGLVLRRDETYAFLHDRVQEAAYSLIPAAARPERHLRIGRILSSSLPPEQVAERIFDIVTQLNRGAALVDAAEERERIAELDLRAGERAKAAAAYATALTYLTAATRLLADDRWERRYELSFAIEYHRAECELLTAELAAAEERLTMLARRARTLVDIAAVACLRITLYTTLGRSDRGVEVCLDYQRHRGTNWSLHPTNDEVRQEYDQIWRRLGGRSIEELIDLPLMNDPEARATVNVLIEVGTSAALTDKNLISLVMCRIVNISLEHGNSDASCFAYTWLGMLLGPYLGDYQVGFRFVRLGYDLVEKRGLHRYQARVYMFFGAFAMPWTKHIQSGRPLVRRALDTANKAGDLTFAAYSCNHLITNLLAAGDPLNEVQREAEIGLEFARKAGFGPMTDILTAQLGLIRTLRGLTSEFGSFNDERFDESRFERLSQTDPRLAFGGCWYWIRKLQARVHANDYASALEAASRAQPLLWTSASFFEEAEYHFYDALARAAQYDAASTDERAQHREALAAHHDQFETWAGNCPENFANRAALVGAEIARLDGRDRDAMDLYEQAIRSARDNGFVHNEAIANERAGCFYAGLGFETISHAYLRNARYCYARWGADAKVRQLDQAYPHLKDDLAVVAGPTSTIGTQIEHLDLATVIKVSQAVSGEIVLEKLIDTLMRTALAQAGAERAVLILARDAELRITAEGTTHGETVAIHLRDDTVTTAMVPEAVLHYALHTRDSVILDDAATDPVFATDSYIRERRAQSILCLPLINQSKLLGVFYLENNLAPRVFKPARISVLRLVASQAAIALENARLYRDLATREAKIRRLVDANIIGIFIWEFEGRILEANDAFLRMVGYDRQDFVTCGLNWRELTPPEWRPRIRTPRELDEQLKTTSVIEPFEKAYFRKDGSQVPVLLGAAPFEQGQDQGVAFVLDITQRKRAEQRLAAQYAVTRILAEAATFEEAVPRILQVLGIGLGWDLGALWRVDPQAGVLRCAALWRADSVKADQFEAATRARTFHPGIGLMGRVWTSRAPVCIPDVTRDPTFRRAEVAAQDGLRAAFACPILLGNEVLGVIDFVGREVRQPDQDWLDMMATIGSQIGQYMERKQTENALQLAQAELAHVMRVMTMGELTASIAHEINQPLAALTSNASACMRWLAHQPPDLDEAGACLQRILSNGQRAGDVITRIRALVKKSPPVKVRVDLNDAIQEVLALIEPEARRHEVLLRIELAADLLPVHGDRVQLQQVILNLTMNGIEAMKEVAGRSRELWIRTCPHHAAGVVVSVQDNGIGLNPASLERAFEAFYTTKAQGMGMGLSISRSIIEAHGGQLWPSANDEHGATFQFTLPTEDTYDQDKADIRKGAGLAA